MGKGSILKNLKSDLQKHDQLRNQKRKKIDAAQDRARKQADNRALSAIRQAFNPFDAKFNRNKSEIGRSAKGPAKAGAPTATRSHAEKERQQVYEAHQQLKNKVGRLVDRRIGRDDGISSEERMIRKYARERANRSKKNFSIEDEDEDDFNFEDENMLADDFKEDMREFQDDFEPSKSRSNRSESEMAFSGLSASSEAAPENERPKTKAEIMQEVIAKSKMYKQERQHQKAADEEIIDTLNADFDSLLSDLQSVEQQSKNKSRKADDYDKNVQQLAFERRADPQDRTKTAEEIEKEKLEKEKQERQAKLARMEGDDLGILEEDEVKDDAGLFGLRDESSDDEEAETEKKDSKVEDIFESGYAEVHIPLNLESLKRAASQTDDFEKFVKECISKATPGRGSGDIKKLHQFCQALTEYAVTTPARFSECSKILHDTMPTHETGLAVANHIRELINVAKLRSTWNTGELLLFSLVGTLFSTSDQWHVVVTSAMLTMCQRLSQAVDMDMHSITTNLFACDLLLAYQRFSKRYVPEIPMYLLRVLAAFDEEHSATIAEKYVRLSEKHVKNVALETDDDEYVFGKDLTPGSAVVLCAKLIQKSASLWRSLDSLPEIILPLISCLNHYVENDVQSDATKRIRSSIETVQRLVKFSSADRKFLQLQEFKPIGIVTRTPLYDEQYNPEAKGQGLDPYKREQQKLKAQLKKERKSTLREIRRDTEFEARQQLSQKRKDMDAYHEKLRRLEGQINGEEGAERNAYERQKKKRKRHY